MTPRILIVEQERELRVWLRHHVEVLWPDAVPEDVDMDGFELLRASLSSSTTDLVVLGMHFADEEAGSRAQHGLRRLLQQPACPPVIVIASDGNELHAVRAIRFGASDYVPRAMLDAALLGTTLRSAIRRERRATRLHQRTRSRPAARTSSREPSAFAVPHYSILHQLGDSSRAAVFLAHSDALGHNVALKVSKAGADAGDEPRHFAREYAAICALRDPCVVDIYDYGIHAGREFIAMEYFPCGDLKTRLRQPLSVAEALQYAERICAALQVVHDAGVVHRDLKPPNIMLREDGSVVLIDFGLAKQIGSNTHSTAAGVLHGSPYYMSPEQAQGLILDQRSDLYSLGVILYEMLSGDKPYLGSTAVEVMQQHVHGPRPPLPPALAQFEPLLETLMARSRGQRVADAATALHELQLHESESADPPRIARTANAV